MQAPLRSDCGTAATDGGHRATLTRLSAVRQTARVRSQGPKGDVGPKGNVGDPGPQGPQGNDGVSGADKVHCTHFLCCTANAATCTSGRQGLPFIQVETITETVPASKASAAPVSRYAKYSAGILLAVGGRCPATPLRCHFGVLFHVTPRLCSFVDAHTLAVSGSSFSSLTSVAKAASSWRAVKASNEHFKGTVRYGDEASFVNGNKSYLAATGAAKATLVAAPNATVKFTLLNPVIADDRGFVAIGDQVAVRCSGGDSYLTANVPATGNGGLECKAASGGKFSPQQLFSLISV